MSTTLLGELRAAGFTVRAVDGALRVSPKGELTGPLRDRISRGRAGLLAALAAASTSTSFVGPPGWVRSGSTWYDPAAYDPLGDPFSPPASTSTPPGDPEGAPAEEAPPPAPASTPPRAAGPARLTPPLKWHGGKTYLAPQIVDRMPRHLKYVEPFAGGLAVLLARDPADRRLWWPHPQSDGRKASGVSEVVNDVDGDLTNFYQVVRDPGLFERLRRRLEWTLFSEREWQDARAGLAAGVGDPVERAAWMFVFCRQSRAGQMKAFTDLTGTRLRGGRNAEANAWWNAVDGLEAVRRRLAGVVVLNRPALEVLRTQDGPATLFYCDPPYLPSTRAAPEVYRHEMSEADHRELLDALLRAEGKVMLSGYRSTLYDGALAGWTRHEFEVPNHAAGGPAKRRMTECVWCNFTPAPTSTSGRP
jgi:DNA adenine methylase